jgi:hypothetical protein
MKQMKLCIVILLLVFSAILEAKTFTSQYTEFELPIGWDCVLEGSEWVCQSADKDRKKEAIIILAAKYRGEQDSLDQYQAYLKQPKSFTLPGGKQQISEAKSVVVKTINGQQWVDALHLASEVPGFYTRYLATVKDTLGIAVTFSVSKDHYNDYQDIFEKIVATLKVFEQKGSTDFKLKNSKGSENLLGGDAGSTIGATDPNANIAVNKQKKNGGAGDETTMILIVVAVAAIGFILLKMKKKK